MTKEEAIEFGNMWLEMNEDCKDSSTYAFFHMAIEALEQEPILDKIRAEFISLYPKNYAGEPELGGVSCVFSLNKVLNIIDKYKASPTGAESEE